MASTPQTMTAPKNSVECHMPSLSAVATGYAASLIQHASDAVTSTPISQTFEHCPKEAMGQAPSCPQFMDIHAQMSIEQHSINPDDIIDQSPGNALDQSPSCRHPLNDQSPTNRATSFFAQTTNHSTEYDVAMREVAVRSQSVLSDVDWIPLNRKARRRPQSGRRSLPSIINAPAVSSSADRASVPPTFTADAGTSIPSTHPRHVSLTPSRGPPHPVNRNSRPSLLGTYSSEPSAPIDEEIPENMQSSQGFPDVDMANEGDAARQNLSDDHMDGIEDPFDSMSVLDRNERSRQYTNSSISGSEGGRASLPAFNLPSSPRISDGFEH
ncbi:hypothetical protein M422DRAFT_255262 [Sphaerobolus stellatus SS14]|uniref:Uncharacterized protein n=1 Tax=Sphaerobolus stellatus (strain SS14) TaxID=990650 RepID=A0A0C9V3Z6_SPHS4|nr:hypothetical protein M422DRAFT_255262 [Sphaerobolus stellatus SS14]